MPPKLIKRHHLLSQVVFSGLLAKHINQKWGRLARCIGSYLPLCLCNNRTNTNRLSTNCRKWGGIVFENTGSENVGFHEPIENGRAAENGSSSCFIMSAVT